MEPDIEHLLIDMNYPIRAINIISQIMDLYVRDNYYEIIKGKDCKKYLDEILALNTTVQMLGYCLRTLHCNYYKQIDSDYSDDFTSNSMLYQNI